jgi:chemotaxis protein methyltransferase CheR
MQSFLMPIGAADKVMEKKNDEEGFQYLLEKIHRNKGLDLRLYRTGTLRRRIAGRMRTTECPDYLSYTAYLNAHPEEYDRLADAVTINVTEFFRDRGTFEVIRDSLIPAILERARGSEGHSVRVWSAGSSLGEEAYSLAILFREAVEANRESFDIRVTGTDIDEKSLAHAKRGVYAVERLKELSPTMIRRHFVRRAEGAYEVCDVLRKMTRFQRHNLTDERYLSGNDLILCRNVIIYFTKPLQEMVQARFCRALCEGGFLVLGRVESLTGLASRGYRVFDLREKIYQRQTS